MSPEVNQQVKDIAREHLTLVDVSRGEEDDATAPGEASDQPRCCLPLLLLRVPNGRCSPKLESPGMVSRMMVVAKQGLLEMVGQVWGGVRELLAYVSGHCAG